MSRVRKNHFAAAVGLFSAISRQILARYHQYLASNFPNLAENPHVLATRKPFSYPVSVMCNQPVHHIAVIPGDGIGMEVVPEGLRVLEAVTQRYGVRFEFDQYANLRPVRLMPGVPSPLAGRQPGDIDFYVVRENREGEYSSIGGRIFPGTEREVVMQETVMTRIGTDRILKYAFDLAQRREKKHLTSAPNLRTRDLGGPADTVACGTAIAAAVRWG